MEHPACKFYNVLVHLPSKQVAGYLFAAGYYFLVYSGATEMYDYNCYCNKVDARRFRDFLPEEIEEGTSSNRFHRFLRGRIIFARNKKLIECNIDSDPSCADVALHYTEIELCQQFQLLPCYNI